MSPAQKSVVLEKLRRGYGVEDIAVPLGLSADTVRGFVKNLRRQRILKGVLGVDPFRNSEALRIMGVTDGF